MVILGSEGQKVKVMTGPNKVEKAESSTIAASPLLARFHAVMALSHFSIYFNRLTDQVNFGCYSYVG